MYKISKLLLFSFMIAVLSGCTEKKEISLAFNRNQIQNIVEVAIIGGGPAGATASIYGARANRHTLVFQGPTPGGLLTQTTQVENWPGYEHILGPNLMDIMQAQAEKLGVRFIADTVVSVDCSGYPYKLTTEEGIEIHALSIIIATGASPAILGVPGEEVYWGRGVTTCAVCDAPFYKSQKVVVIGGGDSAAEEAMQLAPYASQVTVLVRKKAMRAAARMQELLRSYPNITVLFDREVVEIQGDDNHVSGVKIHNNQTGDFEQLPIKGVFLAIGHVPNSLIWKDILTTDQHGYIKRYDGTQRTSIPGIFVAGDVCDSRYRQAIHAAGQGCAAALDADAFLHEQPIQIRKDELLRKKLFEPAQQGTLELPSVLSLSELQGIIKEFSGPIVVDFYTDPCPSCKALLPLLERMAFTYQNRILFVRVHADQAADITKEYTILKVPTLLVLKDGAEVSRTSDFLTQDELINFIDNALNA